MEFLTLLVGLYVLGLVVGIFLIMRATIRINATEVANFPSTVDLYTAVIASSFKPKKSGKPRNLDGLQVAVTKPLSFNNAIYNRYLKLMHYKQPPADVPLMYPIVEAFGLCMQVMVNRKFPFNVLGSVLARNKTTVFRPLTLSDKLLHKCEVDPLVRVNDKGHTEVDLVNRAYDESNDLLVWESRLTVIIINRSRTKAAPAPQQQQQQQQGEQKSEMLDTWQLSGATGRQYGALNGDRNPIHLYPFTSRLFGFKRPIAHALYLVGRAEVSFRAAGVVVQFPAVLETEFKRPTLLPATLTVVRRSAAAEEGASFAVMTGDGAKEVIVGRLYKQ